MVLSLALEVFFLMAFLVRSQMQKRICTRMGVCAESMPDGHSGQNHDPSPYVERVPRATDPLCVPAGTHKGRSGTHGGTVESVPRSTVPPCVPEAQPNTIERPWHKCLFACQVSAVTKNRWCCTSPSRRCPTHGKLPVRTTTLNAFHYVGRAVARSKVIPTTMMIKKGCGCGCGIL